MTRWQVSRGAWFPAKSLPENADPFAPEPPAWSLAGHTLAVVSMMDALLQDTQGVLRFLGISPAPDVTAQFRKACSIAAWFHDWGKANSGFREMIERGDPHQPVRHEAISGALLLGAGWGPSGLAGWLEPLKKDLPEEAWLGAVFALFGHHRKEPDRWWGTPDGGGEVVLHWNCRDLQLITERMAGSFEVCSMPKMVRVEVRGKAWGRFRLDVIRRCMKAIDVAESWRPMQRRFATGVRAMLIASDVAASAGLAPTSAAEWMAAGIDSNEIQSLVRWRIQSCEETFASAFGSEIEAFQRRVEESTARVTLVSAGCGSGKSVAAYRWASRAANGRHLFFCYPTTGTATAGWAEYVRDSQVPGMLFHSRRLVDLDLLTNGADESTDALGEENQELAREKQRSALDIWQHQLTVCTVDTVLGLLGNQRTGLYIWPAIARGAFVFDEIHAYDDRLFGALLRFITSMRAPILLMTASLPAGRLDALRLAFQTNCAEGSGAFTIVSGPRKKEVVPRYNVHWLSTREKAIQMAKEAAESKKRVLAICNTIDRCRRFGKDLGHAGSVIYHSRFWYEHRVRKQLRVIDLFRNGSGIAVTTQVAEMSLDISADVLISEIAPTAALIQRLGRLARYATSREGAGEAFFFLPETRSPYEDEQLFGEGVRFIERAAQERRTLSQRDLQRIAGESSVPSAATIMWSEHTEDLWNPTVWVPRFIREDGYTAEVIRHEDLAGLGDNPRREEIMAKTIPMPVSGGPADQWIKRLRRYPRVPVLVAPAGSVHYLEEEGGEWSIG